MPKMTKYEPGTPSWVDLGSPDIAASKVFYGQLLGWTTEEGPPETGGYIMCMLGDQPVAGMGPLMSEGQPPAWTSYVSVDDADKTVAKAKAAGASVFVEPMDVLDVGRMAIFADPTGAAIAVWQPRSHIGAGLVNEPGTLCWNELNTRDVDASKKFYGSVFDWGAATNDMGGGMSYTEWKVGDNTVGGMMEMGAMHPPDMPPSWLVYFATADCDASVAKAQSLGATTMVPPMDTPPGRLSVLADPQGAAFALIKFGA